MTNIVVGCGLNMQLMEDDEVQKYADRNKVVRQGWLRWIQMGQTYEVANAETGIGVGKGRFFLIGVQLPHKKHCTGIIARCSFNNGLSPTNEELGACLAETNHLWGVLSVVEVQSLLREINMHYEWKPGARVYVRNPTLPYGSDFYKSKMHELNRKKNLLSSQLHHSRQETTQYVILNAHNREYAARLRRELDDHMKAIASVVSHLTTVGQPTVSTQAVLDLLTIPAKKVDTNVTQESTSS